MSRAITWTCFTIAMILGLIPGSWLDAHAAVLAIVLGSAAVALIVWRGRQAVTYITWLVIAGFFVHVASSITYGGFASGSWARAIVTCAAMVGVLIVAVRTSRHSVAT